MIRTAGRLAALAATVALVGGLLGAAPANAEETDVDPTVVAEVTTTPELAEETDLEPGGTEVTTTSTQEEWPDFEPPTVADFDFSPKTVMVGEGDQTVTITATITDESGIKVNDKGEGPTAWLWVGTNLRTAPMTNPGGDTWQASITVPFGVPGGWSQVELANVTDTLGNTVFGRIIHPTRLAIIREAPLNKVRPSVIIEGRLAVGDTVTANPGIWEPATDDFSYQWLRDGEPIDGATESTYRTVPADAYKGLAVKVTASKAGLSGTSSSTSINHSVGSGLIQIGTFQITGSTEMGGTIQLDTGLLEGGTLEYQWLRDGIAIPGDTGPTHTVVPDDGGTAVGVRVNVQATGYYSVYGLDVWPVTVPLGELQAPAQVGISGTVALGETLTAVPGVWGPGEVTLSYQWTRGGWPIEGATGTTYTLAETDVGHYIGIEITGSRRGYSPWTAQKQVELSEITLIPADWATLNGTPKTGQTLTVDPGVWSHSGITFTYEWHRNAIYSDGTTGLIKGVTGPSYKLTPEDVYHSISVRVTGSKPGARTASTATQGVDVWPAQLAYQGTPKLTGAVASGQTLSLDPGTWPSETKLTYTWLRSGTAIPGATKPTYTLTAADVGAYVWVNLTATTPGYVPQIVQWRSPPTDMVAKAATPKVAGTHAVGSTLKVAKGSWTSGMKLAYQWLRDGKPISRATKTSYKLTNADAGTTITARVTGKKSGYETVTLTSAAALKVTKWAKPKISGTKKVGKTLTVRPGSWSAGTTFSYRWYANGKTINGAIGETLVLARAQREKKITVKVTGTRPGFTTVTKTSVKTVKVK